MWKLIDTIITAPFWMLGYTMQAMAEAYVRGQEAYERNQEKFGK